MQSFFALALVALVVVVLLLGARSIRVPSRLHPGRTRPDVAAGGRAIVALDLVGVDTGSDATRRLVDAVASRTFVALPAALVVEVRGSDGVRLGERRRGAPREVAIADSLYDPHAPRRSGPTVTGREGVSPRPGVRSASDPADPVVARALADRFDLPDLVRSRLADPDDAVGLVRAILDAGVREVDAHRELFRLGDRAVIVIPAPIGDPVPPEALNRAYARFRESGARGGVVVTPGFMDAADVRRRETFAPALLHAGPDGIQRMADAVMLGADPVAFAAGLPASEVIG